MTTKEKIIEAQCEGLEVSITESGARPLVGEIVYFSHGYIALGYGSGVRTIRQEDITDICFVEEQAVDVDSVKQEACSAMIARRVVDVDVGDKTFTATIVKCGQAVCDIDVIKGNRITRFYHEIKSIRKHDPDSPAYDIAKERWKFKDEEETQVGIYNIANEKLLAIDCRMGDRQRAVMAAAPELADKLREVVTIGWDDDEYEIDLYKDCIRLLRKLNVPNVAPWYKD